MAAAYVTPTPVRFGAPAPWYVAVGVRGWQGPVARWLPRLLMLLLLVGLAGFTASVALQQSVEPPSELSLRLWTWGFSGNGWSARWALPPLLAILGNVVAVGCASYVQATPSIAMAKASGTGLARFGWRVGRTDRQGRRVLRAAGFGGLLRRRARWPLLVVGLLASLALAAVSGAAILVALDDLGLQPGILPYLALTVGLASSVGFALLMLDGALVAVGPELQVVRVGDGVGPDGYALPTAGTPTPPRSAPTAPSSPPPPVPSRTSSAPEQVPAPAAERDEAAPRENHPSPDPPDVPGRLERLAALHRDGELDDDEYRAAKAAVLKGR